MKFLSDVSAKRQLISEVAQGVAPLVVDSTTLVNKLNAQYVGGKQSGELALKSEAIHVVIGTQNVTTGAWTGNIDLDELVSGTVIAYWLPRAGSGNATLELTLNGGSTTGAIFCYYGGTSRLTTHYGAGSFITMIYLEGALINGVAYTAWWAKANYVDGTESYTVRWNSTQQAGAEITQYKFCMKALDGKMYPLSIGNTTGATKVPSTVEFMINSPILIYQSTTTLAANGTNASSWYEGIGTTFLRYTLNQSSGFVAYKPVYLKGTITSNGTFVLDNTTLTSWFTQDLPSTEDGFVYILFVIMVNTTTTFRLPVTHPIFEYKDGALRQYVPSHNHQISEITSLQTALNGKESSFSKNTAFNKNFGSVAGTVTEGNDSRLSNARTPTSHALGGAEHSVSTLAQLNAKVSDATLIDTSDSRLSNARTPLSHGNEVHSTNFEPANANIQTHVGSAHAPSNAQKNSDITKAEIEAKLTGTITTHTHSGLMPADHATNHITGGSDIIPNAVASGNSGLMSGADKTKLNGIATSANLYVHPSDGGGSLSALANAVVVSGITVNTAGHVTATATRSLTPANIGAEPSFSKNNAFNKNFGTAVGTVCQGNDARLSDARTPSNHNLVNTTHHPVSGLTTSHVLKALSATTYGFGTVDTAGITNSAVTLAKIQNITTARMLGRVTANAGVVEELTKAQVLTFISAEDGAQKNSNITKAEIEAKLTGAITTHTHATGLAIKRNTFTATAGQTVFDLTGGSYVVGSNRVAVYIWGNRQPSEALTETSTTRITLKQGLTVGDRVLIEWFEF